MQVTNIVTSGSTQVDGKTQPTVTIINAQGREEVLNCTAAVAKQVESCGYASQKTRTYELVIKEATKEVEAIHAGEVQVPRGLKLAVEPYNEVPRSALVFRRDVHDGKATAWKAIQTPMGFPGVALEAILRALPSAKLGSAVANGYTWFRSIQQTPGQEYAVLKK